MKYLFLSVILFCVASGLNAERPLDMIDTRVGTDAAVTMTAGLFGKGSEEHGQTLPSVGALILDSVYLVLGGGPSSTCT